MQDREHNPQFQAGPGRGGYDGGGGPSRGGFGGGYGGQGASTGKSQIFVGNVCGSCLHGYLCE